MRFCARKLLLSLLAMAFRPRPDRAAARQKQRPSPQSCRHARGTSRNALCAMFEFRLAVHEKLLCRLHLFTNTSTRHNAPKETAVASQLQTLARRLPKRTVREVCISPDCAREAAMYLCSCHVIARSYGHMRQLTVVSGVSQRCTALCGAD